MLRKIITLIGIVSLLVPSSASTQADSSGDEVVSLVPYRVSGGYCDLRYIAHRVTRRIITSDVTWVAPSIKKKGLRVGDTLISVDGVAIAGMPLTDYLLTVETLPKAGEKKALVFSGKRGLFRTKATVTLIVQKKAENEPRPTPKASSP